jgi:hypothetical protein
VKTVRGVRVRETSADPEVVKLIQAHADVVTIYSQGYVRDARNDMQCADVSARTQAPCGSGHDAVHLVSVVTASSSPH